MKLNSITLAVGMLLAIAGAEAQAQSQPVKILCWYTALLLVARAGVRSMTG